ncbi:MAG: FecR domain-containing protein [Steroidobacteraceae bacterium]
MSGTRQLKDAVPSNDVRAAAAAWIARLHDERRGPDVEAEFHTWIRENETHRRAFNRMTHAWERSGAIRMRASGSHSDDGRMRRPSRFSPWATTLAATLVVAVIAAVYYWRDDALVTRVGQQQARVLQDGTRIVLNTDTRIEVNYDEHARRVLLVRGEARFDVSRHPAWPFLVTVGDREIRALGTSFIVRHDSIEDLSVTLVEGQVSVAPIARNEGAPSQAVQILAPGQRLIVSRHHAQAVDRPELSRVTAWEHGRVEFEQTPLEDAASEMNRYSSTRITVADAQVARLHIGGVFRAGDSDEFVKIVSAAFGLRADRNGSAIVLSRPATQTPPPADQ